MKKLVCEYCGSPNIGTTATVDPNTNQIIEYWDQKEDNVCYNCGASDIHFDEKEFLNSDKENL